MKNGSDMVDDGVEGGAESNVISMGDDGYDSTGAEDGEGAPEN